MQTCPACGKENTEEVKQCTTCYEELTVAEEATEHAEHSDSDSEPAESEAESLVKAETPTPTSEKVPASDSLTPASPAAVESSEWVEPEEKEASHPAETSAEETSAEEPPTPVVEESRKVANSTTVIKAGPPSDGARTEAFTVGSVKLVVEQGLSINKEYLLNDPELIVGRRDPEQEFIPDIDLFDQENANNRYISRRQARLFYKEGGLFVEDLESSNGTVVNNRPIKPNIEVELHPGDKLLFGQSVMFRVRNLV